MYDDKLQDFTHLIRNNDQPSDKVCIELKEALGDPDKKLADIDAQIRLLEERVHELQENRFEIEQLMAPYRPILSPIRCIPPDILFTIFKYCLPTHRNPTMAASEAPMLLTRVCSRWRTIAMTSPRLWARIHIPFQSEGEHLDAMDQFLSLQRFPAKSSEMRSLILQTRCKAIHEWLLRSRDCPLSISIVYRSSHIYASAGSKILCKSTMKLLETIVLFTSRWRFLELQLPFTVYSELESMIINAGAALSDLVQARMAVSSLPTNYTPSFRIIGTLKSPGLKRISISLSEYKKGKFLDLFDVKSPTWSNLTHFSYSYHSALTVHDAFTILKYCTRLIHANFTLYDDETRFDIKETVYLPFLVSLWISELGQSPVMDQLYRNIHAPLIRWIQHKGRGCRAITILPLLENSIAGIRVLELRLYSNIQSNILRRMMEVPSVTFFLNTLHVHCYSFSNYRANMPDSQHIELFDLNDLIVEKSADSKVMFALLPHLENFELHKTRVSDETVLKFITSRIDPTSPIYVLKKIKIVFDRPQDKSKMDLEKEVCKHAAAAGVKIDLTIQYLVLAQWQSQNNMDQAPSPESVIGNGDCRSWEFEDLFQKFVVDDA